MAVPKIEYEVIEVVTVHYDNQAFDEYNSKIEFPDAVREKTFDSCIRVAGICDELVCLVDDADDLFGYNYNLFIWNPSIRKFVTLPEPGVKLNTHGQYSASIGFGFDATTNDYKVVLVVTLTLMRGLQTLAEVYSLATGTWSSLGVVSPRCLRLEKAANNVFVNGVLHWSVICYKTNDYHHPCDSILAFDLGKEVFHEIFMPEGIKWNSGVSSRLSMSGDRKAIALFKVDNRNEDCILDIWGDERVWQNGVMDEIDDSRSTRSRKTFITHTDDNTRNELASLNLASKQVKNLGIDGYRCCDVGFYKESLILLDKTDAESY
ncbi:unnamed protein product [Prunus armeniaca]